MLKKFPANTNLFIWFGLVAILALGGCATILSNGEDTVTFNSNVPKTKVFLDGSKIGETPLTVSIDRRVQNRMLKFTKEGYKTQEMMLAKEFNDSPAMILDVVGTFTTLTPMAVDALSGNMIIYSPTDYHIEMEPEKTGNHDLFRKRLASKRFAAYNFSNIQRDLVTGEGEYLDNLKASFQIPPAHKEAFAEILLANLDALVNADNGLEFWNRLSQLIKEHPQLKNYYLG